MQSGRVVGVTRDSAVRGGHIGDIAAFVVVVVPHVAAPVGLAGGTRAHTRAADSSGQDRVVGRPVGRVGEAKQKGSGSVFDGDGFSLAVVDVGEDPAIPVHLPRKLVQQIVIVLDQLPFRVSDLAQLPAGGVVCQGGDPLQRVDDSCEFILAVIAEGQAASVGICDASQIAIGICQGSGVVIPIHDADQAMDRPFDQERGVRNQGEREDGPVLLSERKGAVGILDQGLEVAGGGGEGPSWPELIFGDQAVAVHAEHVAALAEQEDVVRMGPAITHDRVHLCTGSVSIVGVIG